MINGHQAALARAILTHGPLTRGDLATRLGLSPATLTRLTRPLLDDGTLIELEEVMDGSVGRPSRPLEIPAHAGRFAGIKLTSDTLYAVATGPRTEVLRERAVALTDTRPETVCDQAAEVLAGWELGPFDAVGISLGGLVRDGIVVQDSFLGWHDVALGQLLADRVRAPVSVRNDLVALADAERWFGAGRELPGFIMITIGAGVGYGLVANGETVSTPDAGIGTGSHIRLSDSGPVCAQGHRGCAHALLTSGSIAGQVSAATGNPVTFAQALELAAAGDPAATLVVEAAGEALGTLIALAANLALQSSVLLAGEGIAVFDLVRTRVAEALRTHRSPLSQDVSIHVDRTGFESWARGAAGAAVQDSLLRISQWSHDRDANGPAGSRFAARPLPAPHWVSATADSGSRLRNSAENY